MDRDRYFSQTVLRACDILECFGSEAEQLSLSEIAARTGLSRPTAFRILYTLEHRGLLARLGRRGYRLNIKPLNRRKWRIGYGAQSAEFSFSRAVAESIARAAAQDGIEVVALDNRYSPKTALHNVDVFIRERVDLVIEFQTDEQVAPVISAKLMQANIPLIAIEIPHPGAVYYGADNFGAGVLGGRYLGRWARQQWAGEVDQVLLLELRMAGALPRSRLTGTLMGIRDILPGLPDSGVITLNGNGRFGASLECVRKHLRRSAARRVLVGAVNDPSAIGALRAFEEVGRREACAVMGQNASLEARSELRRPGTRLIGSVAYFPERYGEALIRLATGMLERQPVPPAVFVKHQLVTRENVNRLYANDVLLSPAEMETALLKGR